MSKYYDGSERDSEPKKGTTKNNGTKLVKGGGILVGLALVAKTVISTVKKINNKA